MLVKRTFLSDEHSHSFSNKCHSFKVKIVYIWSFCIDKCLRALNILLLENVFRNSPSTFEMQPHRQIREHFAPVNWVVWSHRSQNACRWRSKTHSNIESGKQCHWYFSNHISMRSYDSEEYSQNVSNSRLRVYIH